MIFTNSPQRIVSLYLIRIEWLFLVFCLLFLFCCSRSDEEEMTPFEPDSPFKIMIVPDIQNYFDSSDRFAYSEAIVEYYLDNIDDFVACFQVGDLTNNNLSWQYQNAYDHFFSRFPEKNKPFFCLGNHDYGNNGYSDIRASNIPPYMYPIYDLKMDDTIHENYVRFLEIAGKEYAVIDLEFAPRNEALQWANEVVQTYSSTLFIILTHVFTNKYGQIHDSTDDSVYHPGSQKDYYMGGDYINDSMEIFNKLINNNNNIVMVICGHTFIPDYIEVTSKYNAFGNEVFVITVNFQHFTNGGNGFVGILEFFENEYRIRSFSTIKRQFGSRSITFGGIN